MILILFKFTISWSKRNLLLSAQLKTYKFTIKILLLNLNHFTEFFIKASVFKYWPTTGPLKARYILYMKAILLHLLSNWQTHIRNAYWNAIYKM